MSPADRAWIALAVGVTVFDVSSDETMSAAVGRYDQRKPWLTRTIIAYLAAHLLGVIPKRWDLLTRLGNHRHA